MSLSGTSWRRADAWISTRNKCHTRKLVRPSPCLARGTFVTPGVDDVRLSSESWQRRHLPAAFGPSLSSRIDELRALPGQYRGAPPLRSGSPPGYPPGVVRRRGEMVLAASFGHKSDVAAGLAGDFIVELSPKEPGEIETGEVPRQPQTARSSS